MTAAHAIAHNRMEKAWRLVREIKRQALLNPKVSWAQWVTLLETWDRHTVQRFVQSCGETFSETTYEETWPIVLRNVGLIAEVAHAD